VAAVIAVESDFEPQAVSPKGAHGLMQLMPATAARFGDYGPDALFDTAVNIDLGVRYLLWLSRRFDNQLDLVLAAYNAGEGAVQRYGNAIPPYAETQGYVHRVKHLLARTQP
jgi:soluble lytic murein transglycosylase-like protein